MHTYRCMKQIHLFENCHTLLSSRLTCSTEHQDRLKRKKYLELQEMQPHHAKGSFSLACNPLMRESRMVINSSTNFRSVHPEAETGESEIPGPRARVDFMKTYKGSKEKRTFSSRSKNRRHKTLTKENTMPSCGGMDLRYLIVYVCADHL